MQIHRRDALKAMASALASFILPAPRPRLDLRQWCARRAGHFSGGYDHRLPYTLDDFTYATDGYRCLRVRPEVGDVEQLKRRVPKLSGLTWDHDGLRGWRELPRLQALEADDSTCHECDGYGLAGEAVWQECETCQGTGHDWVGSGYTPAVPIPCRACKGEGHVAPPGAVVCSACLGNAFRRFGSVVRLDGQYFDAPFYEKVRGLGAEFVHGRLPNNGNHPLLKFRFDGGLGLLMGMDPAGVEQRLVKA